MATFAPLRSGNPAIGAGTDADTLIRGVLFVAAFLAVATSFHPFPSLADPPDITDAGDRLNQIGYSAVFAVLAAWAYFNHPERLRPLLRSALIAVLAWCVLSVVTSWAPLLAARRLAFALVVMGISAMMLLLPKNVRQFGDLMAAVAIVLLALCYLGVALAPNLAVHQATDFLEPELAGDWRGVFVHKNEAGPVMALLVFIGLFVARARSLVLGASIVVLAAAFLIFTHSKTATNTLPLVLIVSAVTAHRRRAATGIAIVLAILAAFTVLSVGSIYFKPIQNLLDSTMSDPTFTGRIDIWQFALDHVALRPLTGYGFAAFWGTEQVVYGMGGGSIWANAAAQAHNSYINLALTIGIPGSALATLWLVVLPLRDYYRSSRDPAIAPLRMLFLRICLFGGYASCFESEFFQTGNVWFVLLIAVFGLRMLAVARVRL